MSLDSVTIALARHVVICGVAAWGVVEGIKPVLKSRISGAWATLAVRMSALGLGAAFGFSISQTAESTIAGAVGGALSTTMVAAIRRLLARKGKS